MTKVGDKFTRIDCIDGRQDTAEVLEINSGSPDHAWARITLGGGRLYEARIRLAGWAPAVGAGPSVAQRHDDRKPQLHYVDDFGDALDGVALCAMYGASKYAPYNYKLGAKAATESYNCTRRHMKAWFNGEDMVPDAVAAGFDVHHIDAAIWNLLRLRQELITFPERDDRPCKVLLAPAGDPRNTGL